MPIIVHAKLTVLPMLLLLCICMGRMCHYSPWSSFLVFFCVILMIIMITNNKTCLLYYYRCFIFNYWSILRQAILLFRKFHRMARVWFYGARSSNRAWAVSMLVLLIIITSLKINRILVWIGYNRIIPRTCMGLHALWLELGAGWWKYYSGCCAYIIL